VRQDALKFQRFASGGIVLIRRDAVARSAPLSDPPLIFLFLRSGGISLRFIGCRGFFCSGRLLRRAVFAPQQSANLEESEMPIRKLITYDLELITTALTPPQGFAGAGAAIDGAGADLLKSKFTFGAVRAPSSVLK
jgi:hypothetical protein